MYSLALGVGWLEKKKNGCYCFVGYWVWTLWELICLSLPLPLSAFLLAFPVILLAQQHSLLLSWLYRYPSSSLFVVYL
jgi:hypothetical protein